MDTKLDIDSIPLELSEDVKQGIRDLKARGGVSEFATLDDMAIRRSDEARDLPDELRPAFNRDIEKILHTGAYNRLAGKTQVFSFRADDDITRRGLHVQLVSRVARDIGQALGLNIDLIEAIALGHDVGHTPFGHAGERFLNDIYHARTGRSFLHNVHSVRVLDTLYGRNLSLQVLDGILSHNGECEQQTFTTSGLGSFEEFDEVVESCYTGGHDRVSTIRPMTLEGCVVRISDIIAYVGKDRQDAIRAKYVQPDLFEDGKRGRYNSWALQAFITDVVEHSFGKNKIEMSPEAFTEMKRAKKENYAKIYTTSEVQGEVSDAVQELFGAIYEKTLEDLASGDTKTPVYRHHILPTMEQLSYYGKKYDWQDDYDRTAADFIASMTDDYFIALAQREFPNEPPLIPARTYFDDLVR